MQNGATLSHGALFATALFAVWPASAQKTTSISLENISGPTALVTAGTIVALSGTGAVNPLGGATVNFTGAQDVSSNLTQGTFTFFLNRLDSFSISATPQPVGAKPILTLTGPIIKGTGAYSGATGSVSYTFRYISATSSSGTFTLTGTGNIKVGATTTAISLVNFSGSASVTNTASGTLAQAGGVAPFGNATVNSAVLRA